MEDEKIKQYKKGKEIFDNWNIDKDIYSGDMPVKTLEFEDKNI